MSRRRRLFLNLSVKERRLFKSVVAVLIGLAAAVAPATPHLVRDHVFSLSVPVIRTMVLFVDLTLAALFLTVFRGVVKRVEDELRFLETRLDSSMRFRRLAIAALELLCEFLDSAAGLESSHQIRMLTERLHRRIAVSVAAGSASRVRVISLVDGRTAPELAWSADGVTLPSSGLCRSRATPDKRGSCRF